MSLREPKKWLRLCPVKSRFRHTGKWSICDASAVETALRDTETVLGPPAHLVHAAAIGSGRFGFPFTNLQPDDWPRVVEVKIMGMVHVAHALAPGMMAREGGTMVFVASIAGQIGSQTDPPYSASKAANINSRSAWQRIWRATTSM